MQDLNALSLQDLYHELTSSGLVARLLQLARDEDLADRGDVTSLACRFSDQSPVDARLVARSPCTVAGLRAIPALLNAFDPHLACEPECADGDPASPGQTLARIRGPRAAVLTAERTLLNLTARLCGVATLTAAFVRRAACSRASIYDTRKTTPGLRVLEKYAVRCGGGRSHRLGLHDALLIKDNHLAGLSLDELPAFIHAAAERARDTWSTQGGLRFVQAEVDSIEQLGRILAHPTACSLDAVLLDNMPTQRIAEAVAMRDASTHRLELEVSGGVTLQNVRDFALTGVERISVGAITHSAVSADLALDL